jgi:hypothetical protein
MWNAHISEMRSNSYNLRGSSTGLFIPRPRTELKKKVSVTVVLNYGIEYQKIF